MRTVPQPRIVAGRFDIWINICIKERCMFDKYDSRLGARIEV